MKRGWSCQESTKTTEGARSPSPARAAVDRPPVAGGVRRLLGCERDRDEPLDAVGGHRLDDRRPIRGSMWRIPA